MIILKFLAVNQPNTPNHKNDMKCNGDSQQYYPKEKIEDKVTNYYLVLQQNLITRNENSIDHCRACTRSYTHTLLTINGLSLPLYKSEILCIHL